MHYANFYDTVVGNIAREFGILVMMVFWFIMKLFAYLVIVELVSIGWLYMIIPGAPLMPQVISIVVVVVVVNVANVLGLPKYLLTEHK